MLQINTVSSFTLNEIYISLYKVYPLDEFNNLLLCLKHHMSNKNVCVIIQMKCNTNICHEVYNFFDDLMRIRIYSSIGSIM